jgi:hypothetical protein
MINNLGGISELELGGLVGTSMDILAARKIKVRRVLAGTYMVRLSLPPLLWSGRLKLTLFSYRISDLSQHARFLHLPLPSSPSR